LNYTAVALDYLIGVSLIICNYLQLSFSPLSGVYGGLAPPSPW